MHGSKLFFFVTNFDDPIRPTTQTFSPQTYTPLQQAYKRSSSQILSTTRLHLIHLRFSIHPHPRLTIHPIAIHKDHITSAILTHLHTGFISYHTASLNILSHNITFAFPSHHHIYHDIFFFITSSHLSSHFLFHHIVTFIITFSLSNPNDTNWLTQLFSSFLLAHTATPLSPSSHILLVRLTQPFFHQSLSLILVGINGQSEPCPNLSVARSHF